MLSHRHIALPTPLGDLLVTASAAYVPLGSSDGAPSDAVVGVYFDGQKYFPPTEWLGPRVTVDQDPLLVQAAQQLTEYFAGQRTEFTLPLAPQGTDFQLSVWRLLLEIPSGRTSTYGALAQSLCPDDASVGALAQGVGQAVGHNPVSIVIPCHRVLGVDGSLTGFAGGIERKRWLLAHEELPEVAETRLF